MEEKRILAVNKEQAERIKDYFATFSTTEGKRVLKDLKAECGPMCYFPGDIWETFRRTINRDFITYIEDKILAGEGQIEVEDDDGRT